MLRGYQGIVCAAVGLALSGAAPPKKEAVTQQAASQPSPTAPPLPDYTPYPDRNADPCYTDKNHDTADLCAQWRAAVAAEKGADTAYWSNWIAGGGALLSFVSIVLVVCALRQTEKTLTIANRDRATATRRAVAGAAETAKAMAIADRNATIAAEVLAEASRANAIQLRPYLNFMGEQIDEPKFERGTPIPLHFKNFGQSPAENVEIETGWDIIKRPIGSTEIVNFAPRERYGTVAPGQKVEDKFANGFAPAAVARIAAGEVLLVRVRLHYTWAMGGSDCCDLTFSIASDGSRPWHFGQLSRQERERTANDDKRTDADG